MGELIDRKWLLDLYDIDLNGEDSKYSVPIEVVRQNIKDAPTVEYRRSAEWIIDEKMVGGYGCSFCGTYQPHKTQYCPECGAYMENLK